MAFVAPLMPWIAGGLGFAGALVSGAEQAAQMQQQAQIDDYRATVARQAATAKGQQTSAAEEALRRQQRQDLGRMRAAIAESGTGFGGSNADVLRQSTTLAELDALNIQWEGNVERLNLLNEADMAAYNARNARKSASQIMRTRWISAFGAGIQGYGAAGGSFLKSGSSGASMGSMGSSIYSGASRGFGG